MQRLTLVVQFLTLVTLIGWLVTVIPRSPSDRPPGRVTVHVDRIVSDSVRYDTILPNLFLEIEMGGQTQRSRVAGPVREHVIASRFVFEPVDFRGFMMFRIRDEVSRFKMTRALLVLTPADVQNKTSAYKADSLNWVVMRIEWSTIKGAATAAGANGSNWLPFALP